MRNYAPNYEPFNTEGWDKCRECRSLPKVWHLDSALQFKCRCQHMYDPPAIVGQSRWHYYREHSTTKGWALNDYKADWNKFAKRAKQ